MTTPSEEVYGGDPPPLGSKIGDYRVLGHWASGAVSHIYVARRDDGPPSDRLFALKVPRTAHAIYAASTGLMLRGAERGPTAVDPYTVSTREVLDRDGRLYMVTDFVNGELLSRALSAWGGQAWPAGLALLVGLHLARALEFVHASQPGEGFRPHGEVNPRNVLLGYDGRARLLDSAIVGTQRRDALVRHLAPEQAAELPDLDARADVYGVGLVMWEMLTARTALVGRNPTEIRAAALEGRIDPPSARGAAADPGIDELVMRSLAVERAQRFQSAAELVAALEAEIARVAPDRDLEADLREMMQRAFPRGASRLSRALQRWAVPPDKQMLQRPAAPLAAIRKALDSRRRAPEHTFADIDAALEDLSKKLPPVRTPSTSVPAPAPAATPPAASRRGVLVAGVAAVGLAAVGVVAAIAPSATPPAAKTTRTPQAALRIVTEPPGARVSVDGQARGVTPMSLDRLEVGRLHAVEIQLDGFAPVRRQVQFDTPGHRGWDLQLEPASAPKAEPPPPTPEEFKDNPY